MKNAFSYLVFALLFINPQSIIASPVAPDYLVSNKDTFVLYSTPLDYYFDIKGDRFIGEIELKRSGLIDNRGYVATWSIEEGKLYLLNIQQGKKSIPLAEEFFEHKTFANWYTGTLYSP
ncbi:hypothetical protein [Carboxylicivirga marina]|nr:hypothetical protein [uncultured Carboxylicivirga sp.]